MNSTLLRIPILLAAAHATAFAAETLPEPPASHPGGGIEGLLGFTNGDQLHGQYLGFTADRRLLWQRDDLNDSPEFALSNIRRVILRSGRPEKAAESSTHVATAEGDLIPGEIISLDDDRLLLETLFAGTLDIPRDRIESIAPNPFGGRISYQGPFAGDTWEKLEPVSRRYEQSDPDEADGDPGETKGWQHSGAAWYWASEGPPTALVRKDGMPESTIFRCKVSWKSRISMGIAFHADFQRPPSPEQDGDDDDRRRVRRFHAGDTAVYADLFGNSYVLQVNPTHVLLFRSTVDEEGNTSVDRMQTSFNNVRLGESGSALIEIRASRRTGDISLFINDEFVAQWSEIGHLHDDAISASYAGAGSGFGFFMQRLDSVARVSDVTVAEWNGMPDSARSMQTDEHDVVLLTNGADRFSGEVTGIANGRVSLAGRYGEFEFPVDEVAKIRFSRESVAEVESPPSDNIRMHLHPNGIISGVPLSGDGTHVRLEHPACGVIDVELSTAMILDMNPGHGFLEDWDPDF